MSLIINAIIDAVKTIVIEAPNALKGWGAAIKEFLESDGARDRRVRECNRRELKQARRELRMERRYGAPKTRELHPNQVRAMTAREEAFLRAQTAILMAEMDVGGGISYNAAVYTAEEYIRYHH
jgi:hypothetical protein